MHYLQNANYYKDFFFFLSPHCAYLDLPSCVRLWVFQNSGNSYEKHGGVKFASRRLLITCLSMAIDCDYMHLYMN